MNSTPNPPPTGDLAVQLRRLSKLLASTVERLEKAEETTALTLFIQDELCQHVERLLDYVAEHRKQVRATVMAADVFANPTAHEEYQPE